MGEFAQEPAITGGVLYADLVGADQAPHTSRRLLGWPNNPSFFLLFRFLCSIFLFTFFKS
jgi:hypothetical protein